ncbi:methionine ABC transporter permease [Pseudoclavibacter caeni]|jgi:D-methionine transport system permease protein|uniref:ABC transporter permease subunit n=1 Tax=Pseudoclavibacter caeni TaxID=908846 RepID=A0A7C8BNA8_9MICO|nr:ABC transporter permease subunit [Pseudoclavibacter caeni]KAB1632347.1 ABC transporter permease subunit [Pseudoclavibacter caeni]NYJ97588.1 D-methionine transport system permease protein [Pseudoclavibacter caeni]
MRTTDWGEIIPDLIESTGQTLYMVVIALAIGGVLGLGVGLLLYLTRRGNLLENRFVFQLLNVLVNFFRPIPFVILIAALQPLARAVIGIGIGIQAATFTMVFAATFGIARLVEQNLVTVNPGVIEAARAMGAGLPRIIFSVLIPEGLGALILGYTYAFVAIVDMSAIAGVVGAGGLGNYAIQYGYRQANPTITWATVIVIVLIVQIVQGLGNWLARRRLRR